MAMLAVPSLQEVYHMPKDSMYIQAGAQFTEITQRLRAGGGRLRKKLDSIYQNFRCHDLAAVEDTFFIYVTARKGEDYSIWLWMNKENSWFWALEDIDNLVKEFVDRYAFIANADIKDRKELLKYYEEALFILNYIYRKSPDRREEFRLYETSL